MCRNIMQPVLMLSRNENGRQNIGNTHHEPRTIHIVRISQAANTK